MIRLLLSLLLLFLSLLGLFRAPTYRLWQIAVIVTEFPWIPLLLCLLLGLSGWISHRYVLPASLITLLAGILFLLPVLKALQISARLPKELSAAFGAGPGIQPTGSSFNPVRMWTGIGAAKVPFQSLTYSTVEGKALALDYYASRLPGRRPCIVLVHGGSWSSGDSRQLPEWNSFLAGKGYQVAAINYRLAPESRSPAPVEDVREALSYLKRHSASLGIDTDRFVLMGRSAGAQLALMAAYEHPDPGIRGVIDCYGPADMVWGYSRPANPLVMDSKKVMEDFLGGTYKEIPERYHSSSPIEVVRRGTVPTLILHGKLDALVAFEHSTRLSQKLSTAGVPHYLLQLPWATNGCDFTLNGPSGQLSTYTVCWFLNEVFR